LKVKAAGMKTMTDHLPFSDGIGLTSTNLPLWKAVVLKGLTRRC
jgi:hypothetical protein